MAELSVGTPVLEATIILVIASTGPTSSVQVLGDAQRSHGRRGQNEGAGE